MMRGEIWWADFGVPFGSEPGFRRPVLIVQDDAFNRSKIDTIIVVPLTSNLILGEAPGNVFLDKEDSGLSKDSVIVVSQLYAIDRRRLLEQATKIQNQILDDVEDGIKMVLGLK
ncbi:MAG: type II toxin-antitoxin system PemK/MazF family toxin [Spirochaetes bacterium]|nr:type II toxin-antitoxin system PemK/MazF family toxin [Spirochaetota bacterium]